MSRALGVDYGTKRVGLAVSDGLRLTARPLEVVPAKLAVERIAEITEAQDIDLIVIGLPTTMGGVEGDTARSARALAAEIEVKTGAEVVLADERFTSRIADSALLESGMKRRARRDTVDKVAAAIILQGYLDAERSPGNPGPA